MWKWISKGGVFTKKKYPQVLEYIQGDGGGGDSLLILLKINECTQGRRNDANILLYRLLTMKRSGGHRLNSGESGHQKSAGV